MRKIVAVGGGEIGQMETLSIDQEIVSLACKEKPSLLFIPTASGDPESYIECIEDYFGKRLNCRVDTLRLIKKAPGTQHMRSQIMSADIIYVGGGNTLRMMNIWRKTGVDRLLKAAYAKGSVLSGLSAGSICWFRDGNSDSRKFTSNSNKLIKVTGLGLIPALHCPHYDAEAFRQNDLRRMMKRTSGVAIALDNCCALEIVDDNYRVIRSKTNAHAYKTYWRSGQYHTIPIDQEEAFKPLSELLAKE